MARIQINKIAIISVLRAKIGSLRSWGEGVFRNRIAVRNLIARMFMYSAMKINAKVPPLNSVLNPDTSSDSPSAKSNGVRLVSASVEINQVTASGGIRIRSGSWFEEVKWEKSNVSGSRRVVIKMSLILTS